MNLSQDEQEKQEALNAIGVAEVPATQTVVAKPSTAAKQQANKPMTFEEIKKNKDKLTQDYLQKLAEMESIERDLSLVSVKSKKITDTSKLTEEQIYSNEAVHTLFHRKNRTKSTISGTQARAFLNERSSNVNYHINFDYYEA